MKLRALITALLPLLASANNDPFGPPYPMPVHVIAEVHSSCPNERSYPVHLTFDDGPVLPNTQIVLDKLDQLRAKYPHLTASFFISAVRLEHLATGDPLNDDDHILIGLISRMKAEGYTIGSHSYRHIAHELSAETFANLDLNDKVLAKLGLVHTNTSRMPFRFPMGVGWFDHNGVHQVSPIMAEIERREFFPVHWDLDTWDWSPVKNKTMPNALLDQICAHRGGIVLMHDGWPFTPKNLEAFVESIAKSGHRFVSLEEIQKISATRPIPLPSLSESAAGLWMSCSGPIAGLDQILPSCGSAAP